MALVLATIGLSGCAFLGLPADRGPTAQTGVSAAPPAPIVSGPASDEAALVSSSQTPPESSAQESQEPSTPPASRAKTKGKPSIDCFALQAARAHQGKKTVRRCEPQSLPYARCRSGVMSCRIGSETGPLDWFVCERKRHNTSDTPRMNSVLILAANSRRKMPTGHVAYVEDSVAENANTYRLVLSHTNYDRRCSLETRIEARYHRPAMTLDILTGAWHSWARGLKVAGFISD